MNVKKYKNYQLKGRKNLKNSKKNWKSMYIFVISFYFLNVLKFNMYELVI